MSYNLTAGLNAQREFANESAVESCLRSLEAAGKVDTDLDTSEEQMAAQETLGDVLTLMGDYEPALEHYGSARKLVDDAVLPDDKPFYLADLYRKTAAVHERRSEYNVAHEWLENGVAYLVQEEPSIEAVRICILRGGIHYRQGNFEEAIDWCQKSLAMASEIGTREGDQSVAHTYYLLGIIYVRLGDLENSVKYSRRSLEAYQQINHIVGQAKAYNNLGSAYVAKGDWKLASEALHSSLTINREIGDVQEQGFVTNNLGNIYLNRGEWDKAAELYRESNSIWKKTGAILPDALTLSNLAQVYIYQANWTQARLCLSRSQALFSESGSQSFIPELERRWSEYYLRNNDIDQALERIQRSIDLASEQEARLEMGMSFRVLGEVHLARDEFKPAELALLRSLRILNDLNIEYEAAKTHLSLSILNMKRRDAVDRDQLVQVARTFERLGAKADLSEAQGVLQHLDKLTNG
jgi:tetratricopeptide (TPR) repeat protein